MIRFLVSLLTGTTAAGALGPWILLGSVLAVGGAGFAAGSHVRGITDAPIIARAEKATAEADGRTEQCKAIHEKGRADGAEQVISRLLLAAGDVAQSMNTLAQKAAARGKTIDQFLKDLANAPPSKVCGGVAAERAYRVSVQPPAVPAAAP